MNQTTDYIFSSPTVSNEANESIAKWPDKLITEKRKAQLDDDFDQCNS